MTINMNTIKGLSLILIAGIGGGFIAQGIANKKSKKKVEEYEKSLEEMKKDLLFEINRIQANTRDELSSEARRVIRTELDKFGSEAIHQEVLARVKTVNLDQIVKDAVRTGTESTVDSVARDVEKESLAILKDTIVDLATDTVNENLKDEMYKVNSRRIIEDAVDHAVREEVRTEVKNKLKQFNIPSWFSASDMERVLRVL